MIFVTVGSCQLPFDRLLRELERLPLDEQLVVQLGPSALRLPRATCVDFMPFETVVERVRQARIVISHAGVGSVMVALANGKRPLVVPRLSKFGEIVDDHQLEFGRRMAESGLVTLVEDLAELPDFVSGDSGAASAVFGEANQLVADLRAYLIARTGPPRPVASLHPFPR